MSEQLGREISVHRGTFMQGGQAWLYGILLLPFALLVPVSWVVALFQDGPSGLVAHGWGTFCVGGIVAVLGPLLLALPILRLTQSARVYERGLVHWSLLGATTVRAEDVTQIVHTIHRYKFRSVDELKIRRRGQRALFITGIARAADLASVVHAWTRGQSTPTGAPPGAWAPPVPAQQGSAPPQGGWTPPAPSSEPQQWAPPAQGGWTPPAPSSGPQQWAPPPEGGWTPPSSGPQQGWAPPVQQGSPAQSSSGWPPKTGGNPEGGR